MSRRAAVHVLLLAGGVALLAWQVRAVGGVDDVMRGLASVGAGFAPILLLSFLRFLMRAQAWRALLGPPAPLPAVLAASISGDALGNLTPFGLAASEPAKAIYLGRQIDARRAFAVLTAENFFYSVSVALYIVGGAVALLVSFRQLPDAIRQAGLVALALMGVVLVMAGWIAWRRPALASGLLRRLPFSRAATLAERVRELEDHGYGSARTPARLVQVALAQTAFHALSLAESWLVLWLLTGESLVLQAFVLDSVNRVINIALRMVPMRVGVDEVTSEAVAQAIGLASGHGLIVALVRKVRMIVWAAIGLGLWQLRDRSSASLNRRI